LQKSPVKKRRYSAKETSNLFDPTDRRHPICKYTPGGVCTASYICTHKSIWINKSPVNPKSTSNQSSKPCTVLQYPSRKVCTGSYICTHKYTTRDVKGTILYTTCICTAYCIRSVISSSWNLNRWSSSLGLFDHVPLKRDHGYTVLHLGHGTPLTVLHLLSRSLLPRSVEKRPRIYGTALRIRYSIYVYVYKYTFLDLYREIERGGYDGMTLQMQ